QRSFKSWVLNGFSKRLAAFSGAGMEITGTRAVGRRDVLVSTRLFRSSGPAVRAAWRIRAMNGGYKILDIMVEGVSMALTQRAEFASVIRRQGLDGLIRRLHAQTAQAQPQPQPSRQLASSQN
ncbi:MAG: ABC transporter substrate-binding protein, partial [Rhodospirillales bacterium]|nr:ABC transporter substrate-binding protein [Rhodospirillales bacterium]